MGDAPIKIGSPRYHRRVAIVFLVVAAAMLGGTYAAVPLYYVFCRATGYNGTTQVAKVAPANHGKRTLTVRFDTNVAPGLDWAFEPEQDSVRVLTGETATVFFKVTNRSDKALTAQALYNVVPDQSGSYFNKISCFCFSEQTLAPHQTAEMPVVFFLDPALEADATMTGVDQVTLSYTFEPVKKPAAPVASAAAAGKPTL